MRSNSPSPTNLVAVITPAAKSPLASRITKLFAELVDAEATLIVVLPAIPSALVRVIPDDAVTANVRCASVSYTHLTLPTKRIV